MLSFPTDFKYIRDMNESIFKPSKFFSSLPFEVSNNYDNYEKLILNKEEDFKSRLKHYLEFRLACYQLKMISSRKTYNFKENGLEKKFIDFNTLYIKTIDKKIENKDDEFHNFIKDVFDKSGFDEINSHRLKIIFDIIFPNKSKHWFVFNSWDSNLVFYTSLTFYLIFIIGFTNKGILDLKLFLIFCSFPLIGYFISRRMDDEYYEVNGLQKLFGIIFLGVALIFIVYKVLN